MPNSNILTSNGSPINILLLLFYFTTEWHVPIKYIQCLYISNILLLLLRSPPSLIKKSGLNSVESDGKYPNTSISV